MRASSKAADAAATKQANNGHNPASPALSQLTEAIETDAVNQIAATAVLEEPGTSVVFPSRSFRLPITLPAECKTTITLLFLHVGSQPGAWYCGFQIARDYDTGTLDQSTEELPYCEDSTDEDTFDNLDDAVNSAFERASWWLARNSGDEEQDPLGNQAHAALNDYRLSIDDDVTEDIFDDGSNPNGFDHGMPEDPPEVALANATGQPPKEAAPVTTIVEPAPIPAAEPPLDAPVYNPCEKIDFEIAACGERIVKHSVEISELKAALKVAKKSWETASDEQVELFGRKAEILMEKQPAKAVERVFVPVLDPSWLQTDLTNLRYEETKPESAEAVESTEAHAARMAAAFAPAPEIDADHSWRSVKIETLAGLTPKIIEILAGNNINTMGDFADAPTRRGIEYTQISFNGAKLTEARFAKVQEALDNYWKQHMSITPAAAPAVTAIPATTSFVDDI